MTKVKKEKTVEEETGGTEKSYQELIANINPIANPLASRKLSKKLYKCVKKGIFYLFFPPHTIIVNYNSFKSV